MCCGKGRRALASSQIIDTSQPTASLSLDQPVVLISQVTSQAMRLQPGVVTVYQADLAHWVRNKTMRSFRFANRSEERQFLETYQDIKADDYQ